MKLAVFTPLNPARCGISDYSEALLRPLSRHFEIDVFIDDYEALGVPGAPGLRIRSHREFRPGEYAATLYHIGNNPFHVYAYDQALDHPGIVVLHEYNLHHLVADATIKRGDWDAYLSEIQRQGTPQDWAFAQRVRALEVGPDYDNLPLNRRLLGVSKAVVVHSQFMISKVREAGFTGPVRRIPHGAWLPEANRNQRRVLLGVDETTPLIGVFGFLKPYKRLTECLRAMQRLVRLNPRVRMILVGDEHPEYPVRRQISRLDLEDHVRVIGYVPIDEFESYIAAADICLNLRYPTVGETSGTLLRALGMAKPVIVSDVGAFSELPGDVSLKVPIGPGEVDLLVEYLSLLTSRPELAAAMGRRGREYVAAECNWDHVADQYAEWIKEVCAGRAVSSDQAAAQTPTPRQTEDASDAFPPEPEPPAEIADETPEPTERSPALPAQGPEIDRDLAEYVLGFCRSSSATAGYAAMHLRRFVRTLEITPPGTANDRILEMGAYLQITPALAAKLGYGEVRGSYLGPLGKTDQREVQSAQGDIFRCPVDLFDAEKDPFPYPQEYFSTVLCCELIEHLAGDPMHMMAEINRILRPGGHLVLTTPNICSHRAIGAALLGYHPGLFHQYIRPGTEGAADPRHSREFAPVDIQYMFEAAGFSVVRLETGPYGDESTAQHLWVERLLERYYLPTHLRGDAIFAVGRKEGGVRERYPAWLYAGGE